ncbi:pentatricopeptide repeat-containing protein 1, mitochondrial [Dermatophagoides farinae]|uniref:pentatricopeptide repeat-containing protein 1, mitochondrial n=1 Tax=Dermatophagoides farinae TaxID=6954 RepID=UPI003F637178
MNSLTIQRLLFQLSCRNNCSARFYRPASMTKCSIRQLCSSSSSSGLKIDFSQFEPDNFGDLAQKLQRQQSTKNSKPSTLKSERLPDDPDGYEQLEIKRGIKISLPGYERILEQIYKKRPLDLYRLLDTYRSMVYEDRYKPSRNIYTMIINACAKAGYTQKAFELYSEMKRYEYRPTRAMITALFNSCANFPMVSDSGDNFQYGLNQAIELRKELDSNGYHYNITQYNVMIKTFALYGDQQNVDATLTQMKRNRISPNMDTYCMLLMGAIQYPENGLYDATNFMRKILNQKTMTLNVAPFNLFLRSIRDCRFESEARVAQLVDNYSNNKEGLVHSTSKTTLPMKQSIHNDLPNLLMINDNSNSAIVSIDFKSLESATNRFLLFGGIDGFLQLMNHHKVQPNLKTFTLMAELLADHVECFEQIQKALDYYNLRPDVCLYNVLIKVYAKQKNREKCERMIREMQKQQRRPDIMTFGALAFTCGCMGDARKFLDEMKQCMIRPNNNIMGTLINLACGHQDLTYVRFLLSYMDRHDIKLSIMDIERIEIMLSYYRDQILKADRNNHQSISKKIRQLFANVNRQFRQMLKNTTIEVDTNVWSQWKPANHVAQNTKYHSSIRYMEEKINLRLGRSSSDKNNYKKFHDNSELDELDEDLS